MEDREDKKSGKIKAFLLCLLVIVIALILQAVLSAAGIIIELTKVISAGTFDVTNYWESYNEFLTSTDVLQKAELLAVLGNMILGIAWYYFGFIKREKQEGTYEPVGAKFEENPLSFPFLIVSSLSCFTLGALLDLLAGVLMPDMASYMETVLGSILEGNPIISFITVVIMAPIGEECIVRGVIAKKSKKAYGVIGCMIISALLFAVFHFNPIQGLYVIPMGLLWGYIAYKYNSVLPSIFCHALNNLIGWTLPSGVISKDSILYLLLFTLAAGAGAVYMAKRMKIFKEKKGSEDAIVA